MSAIFGVIDRDQRLHHDAISTMSSRMGHRGPHGSEFLSWSQGDTAKRGPDVSQCEPGTIFIGVNQLGRNHNPHQEQQIPDLASSPNDGCHVAFDGVILNRPELMTELGTSWPAEGISDASVVLAAWRRWGPGCLDHLVGMFAFCLVDTNAETAWLVVDQFGTKPLFYAERDGTVAFASEMPAIIEAGFGSRVIEPGPLYDFLTTGLSDHDPQTMVRGIRRLRPGCFLRIDLGYRSTPRVDRYWSLPSRQEEQPADAIVSGLSERFRNAVERTLDTDGAVCALLSGGIDSSSIVCSMREILGSTAEIHTFSYLPDDERFNEEHWIDLVNDHVGAVSHKIRVSTEQLIQFNDDLLSTQGEPVAGPSPFAQHQVFKAIADAGFEIVLDGQGADELFGGYRSYLSSQFVGLVKSGHLLAATRLAHGVVWKSGMRPDREDLRQIVARGLPAPVVTWIKDRLGLSNSPWLDRDWFAASRGTDGDRSAGRSLDGALNAAFTTTSLPALLRYEDRNASRFSVQGRLPFLDQDLVGDVLAYPSSSLVGPDGLTKVALREAMRGTVPSRILDRRDKIGFNTPEHSWFVQMAPWVESILESDAMERLPGLVTSACLDDWVNMKNGDIPFNWRFWRWISAARWAELFDLQPDH